MIKKNSVSIVIPMFNERPLVNHTIKELSEYFRCFDIEILIIDDGSTDGSAHIIDELCQKYEFIKAFHHEKNFGIGRALKTGIGHAQKDIIVYTDFDLPVALDKISEAIDLLENGDVDFVIGCRTQRESTARYLYTLVFNFIIRAIFKVGLKDINCPLKAFRRGRIEKIELKSDGPFVDAEFLVKIKNLGLSIAEIPVKNQPRIGGQSKFASPGKIVNTIFMMLAGIIALCFEKK